MDLSELWAIFGLGVAGTVFGAGWWFWIDAVVCSSVTVSLFVHYLPGIFASLAALMFNCVRKEDIDYSPYDEGEWRCSRVAHFSYLQKVCGDVSGDLQNLKTFNDNDYPVDAANKLTSSQLEFAKDRIVMGTERKSMFISE